MIPARDGLGASAEAAGVVVEEVRARVRQRGLDPTRETVAARELIDEVIDEYEQQSLGAGLPGLQGAQALARQVHDAVAGLGPLQPYLDDPEVEELWINEPGRVFIARCGRSELTTTILSSGQVADLIERMLAVSGRRLDLSTPFVDAPMSDGSRLHAVIPDITKRHTALNIRKFVPGLRSLDQLVTAGALTTPAASFLRAAVTAGLTVVVAGATQAGKTTLLNCLAAAIPPAQRVISCEEVFELALPAPDWVALQTRSPSLEGSGGVDLRRLVREALRMRPDRIIVGEVRGAESLDLLIALNSGLPALASLHANSAREAVTKLCLLPLLAGENVSHDFVAPTVALCVDLVVHLAKDTAGRRQVNEVIGLSGRCENGVIEIDPILGRDTGGRLQHAGGYPPHVDRFTAAGYDLSRLLTETGVGQFNGVGQN